MLSTLSDLSLQLLLLLSATLVRSLCAHVGLQCVEAAALSVARAYESEAENSLSHVESYLILHVHFGFRFQ